MVQHEKFYHYCAITSPGSSSSRDDITDFLYTLFHLHPNNTCQPSHIEPLRGIYEGSVGVADLRILSIFQLFESTRRTSITSLLSQWSATPDVISANALEALQSLEPSRVLKTCLEFPDWRHLSLDVTANPPGSDLLYDPVFVLLLLSQTDDAPPSALAWVQFFRTNVVSLILRSLSAKDSRIRELAWGQMASLYKALEVRNRRAHTLVSSLIFYPRPQICKRSPTSSIFLTYSKT